jgi:SHS2 domain-containing protein
MPPRHEEIDHTADIGIRIHAATREGLYIEAARAMFHMILEEIEVSVPQSILRVSVSAADDELLLRAWLAELLYIHVTRKLFLIDFDIEAITSTDITAIVGGLPMDTAMIRRATEIKAVTYHGLSVTESGDEFHAQVILDT